MTGKTILSEKSKMLAGDLYYAFDSELTTETLRAQQLLQAYHALPAGNPEQESILRELFGKMGNRVTVRAGFYCDYGTNIQLGDRVFINFNCIFLDGTPITIGNNVLFGPAVQLYTATHPLDAATRMADLEYALPIWIEDNVWIGGGAIILPNVTIGQNSVIGAGSVVTKNIPPNTLAVGNPAQVVRNLATIQ